MRRLLRKFAMWVAPTAYDKLQNLDIGPAGFLSLEESADLRARVTDLEAQLREMRRDNRRVVELYDLVIDRLRQDNPLVPK